jgi:methanethiol S-methyltransferase
MHASDHHHVAPWRAALTAIARVADPLIGATGLLVASAATIYFLAFLSGVGPGRSVDGCPGAPPPLAAPFAILVDLGLALLFGLQHTGMVRSAFKRRWTRICPPAAERSVYVLASSAALLLLCLAWQPIALTVWHVETTWLRAAIWAAFAGGAVLLVAASLSIDMLALTGLRQTLEHAGWLAPRAESGLVTRGLYGIVRHPIQTGWLSILWLTPTMTAGHLLLAVCLTAYIAIGTRCEERDLQVRFGSDYLRYRRSTGAFLPRPWRRGAR